MSWIARIPLEQFVIIVGGLLLATIWLLIKGIVKKEIKYRYITILYIMTIIAEIFTIIVRIANEYNLALYEKLTIPMYIIVIIFISYIIYLFFRYADRDSPNFKEVFKYLKILLIIIVVIILSIVIVHYILKI